MWILRLRYQYKNQTEECITRSPCVLWLHAFYLFSIIQYTHVIIIVAIKVPGYTKYDINKLNIHIQKSTSDIKSLAFYVIWFSFQQWCRFFLLLLISAIFRTFCYEEYMKNDMIVKDKNASFAYLFSWNVTIVRHINLTFQFFKMLKINEF